MLQKRAIVFFRLAILAILCAFVYAGVAAFAWMNAWRELTPNVRLPNASDCQSILIIGRNRERAYEEETTVPFRASKMALYRKHDGQWLKDSKEYAVRTESTGYAPPEGKYGYILAKRALDNNERFRFGYSSFPSGFFWAHFSQLRGKDALALADWGRLDRKVVLSTTQTLHIVTPKLDDLTSSVSFFDDPTSSVELAREKAECYLHGTDTRNWSFRDSFGCITLLDPKNELEHSDLKDLFDELRKKGLLTDDPPLGLLISDFQHVCDGSGGLAERIRLDFPENPNRTIPKITVVE